VYVASMLMIIVDAINSNDNDKIVTAIFTVDLGINKNTRTYIYRN
jgi:hypothetical protein